MPGVDRLAVGDRVMAAVSPRRPDGGAQAELIVVPAASVVAVPDGASLEQAATLPMNGLTALRGLELLDLPEGATLAVSGGAGMLASYVIGLARERGLRVIADAKPAGRRAGPRVRRRRGRRARRRALPRPFARPRPRVCDAVYDTALLGRTRLAPFATAGRSSSSGAGTAARPSAGSRFGRCSCARCSIAPSGCGSCARLASEGKLKLRVAGEYPPERAAEAQRAMDAGGLRGRALIVF